MGVIFTVAVTLIFMHFSGFIFCRYGIVGEEKYMHFAPREHWRIWTTGLVGWVVATLIMLLVFPHDRLRSQISSGTVLGCFPGILLGCAWYVMSKSGILKVRFKGLLPIVFGTAVGVGIGTFGTIPMLQRQHRELRLVQSFSKEDILQVEVNFRELREASITNLGDLDAIKSLLANAEIYYGRRNVDMPTIRIKIQSRDNTFEYEGFTAADNRDDVILKVPKLGDRYGIRLPGLKRWLDENILSKEK